MSFIRSNKFLAWSKGGFISFQLMTDKITPKFQVHCNQKFAQSLNHNMFLALLKFLVAERMKFWSNFVWHQLKRDKATFKNLPVLKIFRQSHTWIFWINCYSIDVTPGLSVRHFTLMLFIMFFHKGSYFISTMSFTENWRDFCCPFYNVLSFDGHIHTQNL